MMRACSFAFVVGVVGIAACDKGDQPKAKESGALSADDLKLFKQIPKGNAVLVGGNYMKFQNFMQTSLGEMVGKMGPGMKEWSECWTKASKAKVVAGVAFESGTAEMRMAFEGMTVPMLKECADKAGYKVEIDPDNKYVSIEIQQMGQTVETSYLEVPGGILYSRQGFALMAPQFEKTPRAELEADQTKLAQGTAADDKALMTMATKVDRTKTMWFVGVSAGTPIADKIEHGYGSIDIMPGMSGDITVKLTQESMAKKIAEGVAEIKNKSSQVPESMRGVLKRLAVSRNGASIRVTANITDAEMTSLMKQAGMFGAF